MGYGFRARARSAPFSPLQAEIFGAFFSFSFHFEWL